MFSDFFSKISEDFQRFPKTSEDFRKFFKILETCWNVCFALSGAFSKVFLKNFQTFQQMIREPLLLVANRPLNFFMYIVNKQSYDFSLSI